MGKSSKKIGRSIGILMLLITLVACKKEIEPTLQITVVNQNDVAIPNAWVEVSVDRANYGVLNPDVFAAKATDEAGQAFFEFDNTVIVDVEVYKNEKSTVVEDSLSVLAETKRMRGKKNFIERKMVIVQ